MKLFPRYIMRQYLGNLVLGLLIFTFVLLLDRLFELVDLLINKGVGLGLTLQLLFFLLPASLTLTLPMSNLLSGLLTFGHLSETNEITAARASGLSAWSFIYPPLLVAVLSVLFLIPFNTRWAPHAHGHFRSLYLQVLKRNPLVHLEEKTFTNVGDYHIFVEKISRRSPPLRGITIYKMPAEGAPLRIFAEQGAAAVDTSQGITFTLQKGQIEEIDTTRPGHWFNTSFETYVLLIPFGGETQESSRSIEEMDNKELAANIRQLRQKRLPYPLFACESHLRWALAVTPLLFVLFAVPLAIRVHRGGKSIGFGLSILIVLIYYVLLMGGLSFGQRGQWPPGLAVWLGNGVLAAGATFLTWRLFQQ
jgi:lipopolysaccharide export system permease protein